MDLVCANCGLSIVGTHVCLGRQQSTVVVPVLQGWECPKCGTVVSPHVAACPTCYVDKSKGLKDRVHSG